MKTEFCPNMNHRNSNPPVRYCPNCGDVVNTSLSDKHCSEESHSRSRMVSDKYCVHCGDQLVK